MERPPEPELDQPVRPTIVRRLRARPLLSATLATAVVAGVVIVLWWFQPQALLFDTVVDEEFPSVDAADRDDLPSDDASSEDASSDDMTEPSDGTDDDEGMTDDDSMDDTDEGMTDTDEGMTDDDSMDDDEDMADDGVDDTDENLADSDDMGDDTQADPDAPVTLATGSFISRNRYTVEGEASVHELPDGSRVLRFEDLESTNGPDLFVYLTAADADDSDAALDGDAIDLGMLTGNIGDQNYDVPPDVDLDHYDTVVIWCRRFTTSFGAADLQAS